MAGAAARAVPSGTSDNLPNTIVMTVAASNMRTVPATTGVIIRRNNESREISANCISEETTMRLDNIAGPLAMSAVMQIAMNAEELVTGIAYPDPNRQNRIVWRIVPSPQTANAAKNIHAR